MSRQARNSSKDPPDLPPLFNLFTAEREQGSPEILRILSEAREIAENPKQKAGELCKLVTKLGDVRHLSIKTWLEFAEILQLPTEKIKNDLDTADTDDAMKKNETLMRKYINQMCMATNTWDDLIVSVQTIRKQHNFKDQVPYMMWFLKYGETRSLTQSAYDNIEPIMTDVEHLLMDYVYESVIAANDKDTFEKLMQPQLKKFAHRAFIFIGLTNHTGFIELIKKYNMLVADDSRWTNKETWRTLLENANRVRAHDVIVEMNKHYPTTENSVLIIINNLYRDVFSHSYKYIPPKYTSFEQLIENAPKSIPHSELYGNIQPLNKFYPDPTALGGGALGYATANQMLDLVRKMFVQKMKTLYLNSGVYWVNDFYRRYHYKNSLVWTEQKMPWAQKVVLLQYEIEDIQEIIENTEESRGIIIDRLRNLVSSVLDYVSAYNRTNTPRTNWLGINEALEKGWERMKFMPKPAELRSELLKYATLEELSQLRNSIPDTVSSGSAYREIFAPKPPNASGAGSSTDPMVD